MCVNIIKVSMYLGNWGHVISFVSKANSTLGKNHKTFLFNYVVYQISAHRYGELPANRTSIIFVIPNFKSLSQLKKAIKTNVK